MSFHIIGDEDTVLGFRFAGVSATVATDRPTALAAFQDCVARKKCRILLLTRAIVATIEPEVTSHRMRAEPPFLVEIDDLLGTPTRGKSLEELVYEAVGIRVDKKED